MRIVNSAAAEESGRTLLATALGVVVGGYPFYAAVDVGATPRCGAVWRIVFLIMPQGCMMAYQCGGRGCHP